MDLYDRKRSGFAVFLTAALILLLASDILKKKVDPYEEEFFFSILNFSHVLLFLAYTFYSGGHRGQSF